VTAISRNTLEAASEDDTVTISQLDDIDTSMFDRVDHVIHAAATTTRSLDDARNVNARGTAHVAQVAQKARVSTFLFLSTTAVYKTPRKAGATLTEQSPRTAYGPSSSIKTPNAYAISKREAEDLVLSQAKSGLRAAILRPGAVIGSGRRSYWGCVLPHRWLRGEPAAINPSTTLPWVSVDDLVSAIDSSLLTAGVLISNVVSGHFRVDDYIKTL